MRVALTTLKVELSEAGLEMELEANLPTSLQKSGQWRALIGSEIILCEGKAEATKKVKILERGAEGSTKISHAATTPVYHILTAEGIKRYIEGFSKEPFATEIGNGSETSFVIKHELSTKRVIVNVYETASPFAEVLPTVKVTDENHVTVEFLTAPSSKQYTVVVVSGAGPQGPEGKEGKGAASTYREAVEKDEPSEYWPLQEASGTKYASAVGTAGAMEPMPGGGTITAGVAGPWSGEKAAEFDGKSRLQTSGVGSLAAVGSNFSMEAWVYIPESVSHGHIVKAGDSGHGLGLAKGQGPAKPETPGLYVLGLLEAIEWRSAEFPQDFSQIGWHHIGIIFREIHASGKMEQVVMLVDGHVAFAEVITGSGKPLNIAGFITIGARASSEAKEGNLIEGWTGRIAHVACYKRAVNPALFIKHAGFRA